MIDTDRHPTGRIPLVATLAVGASAALLFAIEPFTGKVLLPRLGGSPSVWNSCVMVFQILLLAGYGYSALLVRVTDVRKAVAVHAALVLLSIAVWPLAVRALWLTPSPGWSPVLWVVVTTLAGIGLPFALLSATSPLLQVWLARASAVPLNVHRLYAASNLASVAGLAAYVGVLEPFVGVTRQSSVIWVGYASAMALALTVAMRVRGSRLSAHDVAARPGADTEPDATPPAQAAGISARARVSWIALSFAASLCLYAVNTYISTDVASFPLLWCLPLGVFLSGFAVGFSAAGAYLRIWLTRVAKLAAVAAIAHLVWIEDARTVWAGLLAPLVALTFLVTALAAELAHRRPREDRLAGYYAWVGLGGVIAGVASVVVLPWAWSSVSLASVPLLSNVITALRTLSPVLLTDSVPEYAAALLLATWLLSSGKSERDFWRVAIGVSIAILITVAGIRFLPDGGSNNQRWALIATAVASAFAVGSRGARLVAASVALAMVGSIVQPPENETMFEARNFFGTSRVQRDSNHEHRLKHGTTLHGIQPAPPDQDAPASYYGASSPLGQLVAKLHPTKVIAVGLGVGTVAAYGQAGDHYRFVEINPLVEEIATNPEWFSYISAARHRGVTVDIDIGDGRLAVEAMPDGVWDLIVVDAFSSDAIPVHLLSIEAVQMFRRKLSARGILAFHISNRFFDLAPVLAAAAARAGMPWTVQSGEGISTTEYRSTWVMLAGSEASARDAGLTGGDWPQPTKAKAPWTDDWANVLGTMRSWKFWSTGND